LHKDVYEYLVESGISCEYMEKEKQIKIFIQTEGNQYELRMKFPQYYPYEFPEIYIEDQKELCIPHLYTDNKLCLYDKRSIAKSGTISRRSPGECQTCKRFIGK
jgi:hypothetical protein